MHVSQSSTTSSSPLLFLDIKGGRGRESVRVREREIERERERDRERERQGETEGQRERDRERETDRQTDIGRKREGTNLFCFRLLAFSCQLCVRFL